MGNRPLLQSVSNLTAIAKSNWIGVKHTYYEDSYFKAEDAGAQLLPFDKKCTDDRFVVDSKGNPKFSIGNDTEKRHCQPLRHSLTGFERGRMVEYMNNNPSLVRINKDLRKFLPIGEFIVIKCTAHLLCEMLNWKGTKRPPLMGTSIVQVLDARLRPIAQTHVEICPKAYKGSRQASGLTELKVDSRFEKRNSWIGNMNGFARSSQKSVGNACGLLAAEDSRIFYLRGELYIMTFCHVESCRGQEDIYRARLHIHLTENGQGLVAYVVQSSKIMIPQFGRNFNFWTTRTGTSYMLSTFHNLEIINLDTGLPAATIKTGGLGPEWHLHGGQLIYWKSKLHRGFLGIAHKHGPFGLYHVPWGSRYVSAFFLLSEREPFRLLRWGVPFCFASLEFPDKCEVIQFISSVVYSQGHLIIGYGVNDCESRFWSISVEAVNAMLDAADPLIAIAHGRAVPSAPGAPNSTRPVPRSYLKDSYFLPEDRDAYLLTMTCNDPARFPHCAPRTLKVIQSDEAGSVRQVTAFNPSIIPIEPFMRPSLPYGKFIALLRTDLDQCATLRSYDTDPDTNHGAIIAQILDEHFNPIAQTYVELCSAPPAPVSANAPETTTTTAARARRASRVVDVTRIQYSEKNSWWGDMNAFRPVDSHQSPCGLLAGEDPRLFYLDEEVWMLNACFGGSCKGYWKDIYRTRLYFEMSPTGPTMATATTATTATSSATAATATAATAATATARAATATTTATTTPAATAESHPSHPSHPHPHPHPHPLPYTLRVYTTHPKTPIAPLGKNFVFFTVPGTGKSYMVMNVHKMDIYNLHTGAKAKIAVANVGMFGERHALLGKGGEDWHLQGGSLVPWKTPRFEGHLGVAHRHIGVHGKNFVQFGSRYISALFLISSNEPFELVRFSDPFCLSSLEYPDMCEVIQFISGVFVSNQRLVLAYGANDCDGRVWSMTFAEAEGILANDAPYRLVDYMAAKNATMRKKQP